jgi:ATP-binding cassette subfamily B protein
MNGTIRQAVLLAWSEADAFIKKRLALTLLLVIGTAVFAALAPIALKYAVDGLGDLRQSGAEPGATLGPTVLLLVYIAALWISRSLGEARWFLFGTADQRLHRRLSRRLLAHIIDLPMAFHLDRKTGALNQTLVQGLMGYRILMNHLVFTVLPVLVEVVIIGVVLAALLRLEFLGILGVSVVAYAVVFALGAKRIIGPAREVSTSQIEAHATMTDSILNAETVKCFNAEAQIQDRYDGALAETERRWSLFYWRKSENGLLAALVFALSLGAAMLLGAVRVRQGVLSVGDFVALNAYMLQIVRPLETLGAAFRDIAHGAAFIEKMMALMGREREVERSTVPNLSLIEGGERRADGAAGALEVRELSFSYHPGRPVLENIDFAIRPGETVAVVGKSGAGKSSLVRLLMRFYDPASGDIRLNGQSIRDLPLDDVRRAIAIVPQDTILFNDTIAYNIGFGRRGEGLADIERAARFAHIHERIMEMPDGYDTIVGERGLKLSGGEKQRVSIARAVLKQPQLFIFDEATSSLDAKTEQTILDNLIEVSRGMTTLIISHRLSMVAHADEILVLEAGRIIERGRHDELLEKNSAYAAMWRTQQGKEKGSLIGRKETA